MATAQEQAQVNTGVANANILITRLGSSFITWTAKGGGTKVSAKITSEFAGLVSTNINPLSSARPIFAAVTTLTNFSVPRGVAGGGKGNVITTQVGSLDLWNAQYVAWSIQLPIILQLGGVDSNKAPAIIASFNTWYTTNIVPLIPKVKIGPGFK